jgi:hypothetical protein
MTIFSKSSESVFPKNYGTQEREGEREAAGDYNRVRNEQMTRGPDGAGFSSKHIFFLLCGCGGGIFITSL